MLQERQDSGVDSDLQSGSCTGMGVMYPQVWEVIRRYILRGDPFYQHGGLSILAQVAWEMPLNEAAEVLEQYFEKHNYFSEAPARGGIALPPLRAAFAVGTTPGWDGSNVEDRRTRMIKILQRCAEVGVHYEGGEDTEGDVVAVLETIEAIRNNAPGFQPHYRRYEQPRASELPANGDQPPPGKATEQVSAGLNRDEILGLIRNEIANLTPESNSPALSAMDLVVVRHGFEMLEQRIALTGRLTDERISALDKAVDRHIGERQVLASQAQIKLGKRNILWMILIGIMSAAVTLAVSAIGPRLWP